MLFGTCNCRLDASAPSRRGLLCAGGVGFVSALIGTLVGTLQTARAQALGSQVPEVDRLAIRMVTDNQVIQFVPPKSAPASLLSEEQAAIRLPMRRPAPLSTANGGCRCMPNCCAAGKCATS